MSPDALERVRMCLAEAGVCQPHEVVSVSRGFQITRSDLSDQEKGTAAWRALEVAAGFSAPLCRACYLRVCLDPRKSVAAACQATVRLTEDCGRTSDR